MHAFTDRLTESMMPDAAVITALLTDT